ncbi:GyrI-like domain-containing protein [Ornithinimicrobium faecis]|uniref:GyrI-like domain-containing protein n=1 Tax=Ornithinimicrobium faecis TaxID=2934158 RepID=UPI0021186145|nr:GyrI-like domain-containing protein [Ornithinimicrobium sp. HY1745]
MTEFQDPEIVTHEAVPTAVVRERVTMDDLPGLFDRAFTTIGPVLEAQGVQPAGAAFGYYLSMPTGSFELEAGLPVTTPITDAGEVIASELPAGDVARATHAGAYDTLGESWGALVAWAEEQGRTVTTRMWEVYVTDPSPEMDPATLRTDLFLLLAD